MSGAPDTTAPAVTEEDRAKAAEITGCVREVATDCPFHGTADCGHRFASCGTHDDMRDARWEECRWAPVAAALAAERGKADALRAAMHALAEDIRCGTFGQPPAVSVLAARLRAIADGQR